AEECVMPSNIILNPARPDDDFKAQQKLGFDRWRIAIGIVEHMREAGFSCELSNSKTATDGRQLVPIEVT
ncbi:MAG: hypothetical protein WBW59_11890, partial [Pseudolabrys sp.]